MGRRRWLTRLTVAAALVAPQALLLATPTYRLVLAETYPNAPSSSPQWYGSVSACNTCHYVGEGPEVNDFGEDFSAAEYDLTAIEELDSDRDGVSNREEIGLGTLPGVSREQLALFLVGAAEAPARIPNANGDRSEEGNEIIDAADLVFRFMVDEPEPTRRRDEISRISLMSNKQK